MADWYVDAGTVNCASGTGSAAAPFCTIGEAIHVAVAGDTVHIAAGTYVENLTVDEDLRLIGTHGREVTVVDGGGVDRVFDIQANTAVTIEGLTIRGGAAQLSLWSLGGGGIRCAGSLTLRNSTVSDNSVVGGFQDDPYGGGLLFEYADESQLVNCVIERNSAIGVASVGRGGGICTLSSAELLIANCTITDNDVSGSPGLGSAAFSDSSHLRIEHSTISGNDGNAHAVSLHFTFATLTHSTLSGNSAGALYLNGPVASLEHLTIVDHGSGHGLENAGFGPPELRNSVIAGNSTDVSGSISSLGHNLIGVGNPSFTHGVNGDQVGTTAAPLHPMLAPLAHLGGSTATAAPLPGSPVIDAGDPTTFVATDQRGFGRIGAPDIGAHESSSPGGPTVAGCSSASNSTGATGAMSAAGRTSVGANALTLSASSLPVNALAIFLTSLTPGFVASPGGSTGNLCLGGAIGRFVGPGQILDTGTSGAVALAIDLDRQPTPGGLVPVSVGDTWYFQCWHRDAGAAGPTSNFTAATQVTFTQ